MIRKGAVGTAKVIGYVIFAGNTKSPGVPTVGNTETGAVAKLETVIAQALAPAFKNVAKLT